jgi:hypothetical protein
VPAPLASAAAVAAPSTSGGPGPVDRPDEAGPTEPEPRWHARRHRRLQRLRAGQHAAPHRALEELQVSSESFGLLLGGGQAGEPVVVRLFRRRPSRVVLVGGAWAAELVAFRALRFGARAVVFAQNPAGWVDLGRRATGRTDRVAVLAPGSPVSMRPSEDSPVLRLTGPEPEEADGPPEWTTTMSVLPRVAPAHAAQLAGADLVLAQRLSPPEAAGLASILDLPARTGHLLRVLHDDMLAVLAATGPQYAWVRPSSTELDTFGPPARY